MSRKLLTILFALSLLSLAGSVSAKTVYHHFDWVGKTDGQVAASNETAVAGGPNTGRSDYYNISTAEIRYEDNALWLSATSSGSTARLAAPTNAQAPAAGQVMVWDLRLEWPATTTSAAPLNPGGIPDFYVGAYTGSGWPSYLQVFGTTGAMTVASGVQGVAPTSVTVNTLTGNIPINPTMAVTTRREWPMRVSVYLRSQSTVDTTTYSTYETWVQAPWIASALPYSRNWMKVAQVVSTSTANIYPQLQVLYSATNRGALRVNEVYFEKDGFDPADHSNQFAGPTPTVNNVINARVVPTSFGYTLFEQWGTEGAVQNLVNGSVAIATSTDLVTWSPWTTLWTASSTAIGDDTWIDYQSGSLTASGDTLVAMANRRNSDGTYSGVVKSSTDGGNTWSAETVMFTSVPHPLFHIQGTVLSNGKWIVPYHDESPAVKHIAYADSSNLASWATTTTNMTGVEVSIAETPNGLWAIERASGGYYKYATTSSLTSYGTWGEATASSSSIYLPGYIDTPLVYRWGDKLYLFFLGTAAETGGDALAVDGDVTRAYPRRPFLRMLESDDWGATWGDYDMLQYNYAGGNMQSMGAAVDGSDLLVTIDATTGPTIRRKIDIDHYTLTTTSSGGGSNARTPFTRTTTR